MTRQKAYANQSGADTEHLQNFTKFMLIHKILSGKFGVFTKFLDHENLEPYGILYIYKLYQACGLHNQV